MSISRITSNRLNKPIKNIVNYCSFTKSNTKFTGTITMNLFDDRLEFLLSIIENKLQYKSTLKSKAWNFTDLLNFYEQNEKGLSHCIYCKKEDIYIIGWGLRECMQIEEEYNPGQVFDTVGGKIPVKKNVSKHTDKLSENKDHSESPHKKVKHSITAQCNNSNLEEKNKAISTSTAPARPVIRTHAHISPESGKLRLSNDSNDPRFSLCFPSISTTAYKFDIDRAAPKACFVISKFLLKNPDERIRLYLVDITDSPTLKKFREHAAKIFPSNETRFKIVEANLVKLKDANIPCQYIVNASNPSFSSGGSGTNRAIHEACKNERVTLKQLTKLRYGNKEAETAVAYPVDLPPECPLRMEQDVRTVIHVVGPNMDPTRARCLTDYKEATRKLEKSYEQILDTFYNLATTLKSSNFITDD